MRSFSHLVILVVAMAGSFAGCQGGSPSSGGTAVQDDQWPALLAQRENQPTSEWHTGSGWIDAVNSGWGTGGLAFREPRSAVRVEADEALNRNPRVFVPLLASKDPQVVLTAVWIYRDRAGDWRGPMTREDRAAIAEGFRALLDHEDMRMRWAAVQTLGENRMLTVADVAKGLADESEDVRATTGFWAGSVREGPVWDVGSSGVLTREERSRVSREIDRKLIPVLLAHLDDPDFRVREACARRGLVVPCNFAIKQPAYCDFVRAAPAEYTQAKRAWQAWWEQHGEETLAAAQ